jgi:hypothetical protein
MGPQGFLLVVPTSRPSKPVVCACCGGPGEEAEYWDRRRDANSIPARRLPDWRLE